MTKEPRKIFVYLAIMAVILAFVGVSKLRDDFTGKVVIEKEQSFQEYAKNEVERHNSEKACWVSVENRVYDITLFLQIYESSLKEKCGEIVDINSLSLSERKSLEEYDIGRLK